MISIKSSSLVRTKSWTTDSIYILADFDRTLTSPTSETSWGVLSKTNIMCEDYNMERKALFEYYRPIELNHSLDFNTKNQLMIEWWYKHIQLFIKYGLSENIINSVCKDFTIMRFRAGAQNFLKNMYKLNIPVIIISAGIGNFIKAFLISNNCDFDNIYIISNFIKFENGIAVGISDNLIHSLNKNTIYIPKEVQHAIQNRNNIVLFGDSINDIDMTSMPEQALKIGFLDENIEDSLSRFEDAFDIVAMNNTSFDKITNILSIFDS